MTSKATCNLYQKMYEENNSPVMLVSLKLISVFQNQAALKAFGDNNLINIDKVFDIQIIDKIKSCIRNFKSSIAFDKNYTLSIIPIKCRERTLAAVFFNIIDESEVLPISSQVNVFDLIAHETKMPIAMIHSSLNLLKNMLPVEVKRDCNEYLGIIDQNCFRLLHCINDIIDTSRCNQEQADLFLEVFDINRDIVSITSQIRLTLKEHSLFLKCMTPKKPVFIKADKNKIERVILNLFSNAIKYTPDGGKIHVRLSENENNIILTITDTGIGIRSQNIGKIFDLYYTTPSINGTTFGLGVGLYITKCFVTMHGGTISVKSGIKGTSFSICLPKNMAGKTVLKSSPNEYKIGHMSNFYVELSDFITR